MTGPSGEQCAHCYYYAEIEAEDGLCQRYPPKQINASEEWIAVGIPSFSEAVNNKAWCGEFKPHPGRSVESLPTPDIPSDDVLLSDLPLSIRTLSCFKLDGRTHVKDVRYCPDAELIRTPNFGRKSLRETRLLLGPHIEAGAQSGANERSTK
jgi:hypothetical protein